MKRLLKQLALTVAVLWVLCGVAQADYAFTLDYATNDTEEWTFTADAGDTTGTLTFRNTNYGLPPVVILVPNDTDTANDNSFLGTPAATTVTVNKSVGGAGTGRVIVMRRR